MLKEFKDFITQGNIVMLAVAVVIGLAFQAMVKALVADIITPLISIPGKANFQALSFQVNGSTFLYGDVLNYVIAFLATAAALFFLVVKPYNAINARRPTTRECPACLTEIPIAATRCAACTSEVPPVAAGA